MTALALGEQKSVTVLWRRYRQEGRRDASSRIARPRRESERASGARRSLPWLEKNFWTPNTGASFDSSCPSSRMRSLVGSRSNWKKNEWHGVSATTVSCGCSTAPCVLATSKSPPSSSVQSALGAPRPRDSLVSGNLTRGPALPLQREKPGAGQRDLAKEAMLCFRVPRELHSDTTRHVFDPVLHLPGTY